MKRIFLAIILGLVLCGVSFADNNTAERYPYKVKITSNSLYSGKVLEYYLTSDKMIVFGKLKRLDSPKELFSRELTEDERKKITDFLATFPLDKLQNEYFPKDNTILDGYAFGFSFKLDKNNVKEIRLANTYQKELHQLVEEINSFLPEKLKIFTVWEK